MDGVELLVLPLQARAGTCRGPVQLPSLRAVTQAVMPAVPQQRWVFRSLLAKSVHCAVVCAFRGFALRVGVGISLRAARLPSMGSAAVQVFVTFRASDRVLMGFAAASAC